MPAHDTLPATTASRLHVPSLDGVRGLAIAIVLVHNATFILHNSHALLPKTAAAVAASGWLGVQLFFVLSGFLITGILLDSKSRPTFFRTFYVRRTLRIFPLYYTFLVGAILVVPLFVNMGDWLTLARRDQLFYWTYTSNWANPLGRDIPGLAHFWSLAVEEQFYLVWPLLVFFASRQSMLRWCVALMVLTPLVRAMLRLSGFAPLSGYEFTIARWDALAAGALLAIAIREDRWQESLARNMKRLAVAAGVLLLVFVVRERGFHENDLHVQVIGQTLISVLASTLIYACLWPAPNGARVRGLMENRGLRLLGKYSYAMYVFHYPIHYVASRYFTAAVNGPDDSWRFARLLVYIAALTAASLVAALISWRLLEEPFLGLKERFAPRDQSAPSEERTPPIALARALEEV